MFVKYKNLTINLDNIVNINVDTTDSNIIFWCYDRTSWSIRFSSDEDATEAYKIISRCLIDSPKIIDLEVMLKEKKQENIPVVQTNEEVYLEGSFNIHGFFSRKKDSHNILNLEDNEIIIPISGNYILVCYFEMPYSSFYKKCLFGVSKNRSQVEAFYEHEIDKKLYEPYRINLNELRAGDILDFKITGFTRLDFVLRRV